MTIKERVAGERMREFAQESAGTVQGKSQLLNTVKGRGKFGGMGMVQKGMIVKKNRKRKQEDRG